LAIPDYIADDSRVNLSHQSSWPASVIISGRHGKQRNAQEPVTLVNDQPLARRHQPKADKAKQQNQQSETPPAKPLVMQPFLLVPFHPVQTQSLSS
jgi:hypothetical protein